MERNNSDEECAETERCNGERRHGDRRKRNEPVLLDTRAPRERREGNRRQEDETSGAKEPNPETGNGKR